jgi:hypothetical protein
MFSKISITILVILFALILVYAVYFSSINYSLCSATKVLKDKHSDKLEAWSDSVVDMMTPTEFVHLMSVYPFKNPVKNISLNELGISNAAYDIPAINILPTTKGRKVESGIKWEDISVFSFNTSPGHFVLIQLRGRPQFKAGGIFLGKFEILGVDGRASYVCQKED